MVGGVWKYLAATWSQSTILKFTEEDTVKTTLTLMNEKKVGSILDARRQDDFIVDIATDASFAPGGDRSRSGIAIKVGNHIAHRATNRQTITAISSCEAELNATVVGIKIGVAVRDTLDEMVNGPKSDQKEFLINHGVQDHDRQPVLIRLRGDNLAALRSIVTEISSWRSRHYANRAGWVRDMVENERIQVVHEKGTWLVSDALTKILDRVKLGEARQRLGMITL